MCVCQTAIRYKSLKINNTEVKSIIKCTTLTPLTVDAAPSGGTPGTGRAAPSRSWFWLSLRADRIATCAASPKRDSPVVRRSNKHESKKKPTSSYFLHRSKASSLDKTTEEARKVTCASTTDGMSIFICSAAGQPCTQRSSADADDSDNIDSGMRIANVR